MSTRRLVLSILFASTFGATAAHAEPHKALITYKRLYVRGGVLHIAPMSKSRELTLSDVHGPASLAVMDGPIAGSGAALDPVTIPAVIAGYTLPIWHDRLSIETVLSTPLHVTFRATGTLADMSIAPQALGLDTGVPALGAPMGAADAAPPLVTAVYRIADLGPLHPYAGTGVGVLVTYNAHATNPVLTEAAQPKFHRSGAGLGAAGRLRSRGVATRADSRRREVHRLHEGARDRRRYRRSHAEHSAVRGGEGRHRDDGYVGESVDRPTRIGRRSLAGVG